MRMRHGKWVFWAASLLAVAAMVPVCGVAQTSANLPLEQIVERMLRHDLAQRDELKHYESERQYEVTFHGFASSMDGKMDVEITYDAATGKSFRVVSQSGSKLLCDKVLKKTIEGEEEASHDRSLTALTPENYKFELLGSEILDGRPAYILKVDPVKDSKFLYRGKVWIDAADFAVARIEATPAKNPSFWISRTVIDSRNEKHGEFWLPKANRSETKVKIGGNAVLTINYGSYRIVQEPAVQVAAR